MIGAKKFRRVNPEYLIERNVSSAIPSPCSTPTPLTTASLTTASLASMGMDIDTDMLPPASPTPVNVIPRTQGVKRCINQVSNITEAEVIESETNEL
jgi:hypothetical protein